MDETFPKVSIILLHWNRFQDTCECLQSLFAINYPNFEILIVDNHSTDGSYEELKRLFPKISFLQNEKNLGFAEGNNRGIKFALEKGADFVLLLNNDTVVDPTLLHAFMQAASSHPQAGVFGAKIYYYDDPTVIWYAGGEVHPTTARCYHVGCTESDLEKTRETIQETGYACGCAMLIRKEVIQRCGMMEARFFLIWEEIDWCWRIRKCGYTCLFVPQAKVWHKISASFEGGNGGALWQYYYWRNRLLFLERQYSLRALLSLYAKPLLGEVAQLLIQSINFKTPKTTRRFNQAALRGVFDYCLRRFGAG